MAPPARPLLLDDDVDGKMLARIVQQFRDHHALRYEQSGRRLPATQRLLLRALPLLYHWNHPALPGFVSHGTPRGLHRYRPEAQALSAARRFAPSYQAPRFDAHEPALQAMFIMGSGGSVGQTRNSDIDLWICCDHLLHQRLWPKVRQIDTWARSLGLDLHTFLVDPDVLRRENRLPGSHTPSLLLDEFYRSAVLLAGRYPLWWLIPEDDPSAYHAIAERLLHQRFVPRDQVLDFGPVPAFPDEELAQAAAAELRRSLRTPQKSLLKLKLIEAYAAAPGKPPLSSEYRRRIHAGEDDPLRLDPYLLLYDYLDAHCRYSQQPDSLQLIRRLLVSKTAEHQKLPGVSRSAAQTDTSLNGLFQSWGIDTGEIKRLRTPSLWSIDERKAESDAMAAAMQQGIGLIEHLTREQPGAERGSSRPAKPVPAGQRTHLGWLNRNRLRHLRLAVSRLECASTEEIPRLHPAMATIRYSRPAPIQRARDGWSLGVPENPAYVARRLVSAIAWAELNRVRLRLERGSRTAQRAMAQIRQGLREGEAAMDLFVNAEPQRPASATAPATEAPVQTEAEAAREDVRLMTQQQDPLDYSGFHSLQLHSFDLISRDREGRWHGRTFAGAAELTAGLAFLLAQPPEQIAWHVVGGYERLRIGRRLQALHGSGYRALREPGGVFVMPFGADNLVLTREASGIRAQRFSDLSELLDFLRKRSRQGVIFDPGSSRFARQAAAD